MSAEQVVFVGFLASAIVFALKMLANWFDFHPNRAALTIVLYVVSLGLGWLWTGVVLPTFPPFSDPLTFVAGLIAYISAWLTAVAPVLGMATLIYNLLYEKVVVPLTEKIDVWHVRRFLKS